MAQWYYSIKFDALGKDELALIEKISQSMGYEPETIDANPRWDCKHTAYEAVIEPILKEEGFSGIVVSDGEISGYPVQEWTLEDGTIRIIEEFDDNCSIVREEQFDKDGTLVSTKICDENGDLVEEAKPSFYDIFQSSKALYDMGKGGNQIILELAIKDLTEIKQKLSERNKSDLSAEEKSVIDELNAMDL